MLSYGSYRGRIGGGLTGFSFERLLEVMAGVEQFDAPVRPSAVALESMG